MPAVELNRLKSQTSELAWRFTRPVEFQRQLNELLSMYADRVYRPGQTVVAGQLAEAYHVPILVMRQVQQELVPLIAQNPGSAISLADILWQDTHLEPRLLAAYILNQLPASYCDSIIQRLDAWCRPEEGQQALDGLLTQAGAHMRRWASRAWFSLIESWLGSGKPGMQNIALQALQATVKDQEFENLPMVYQLITPLARTVPTVLQGRLTDVLEELARRSPNETAHFLRQVVSTTTHIEAVRLARRILPLLPASLQENLRSFLITR